MVPDGALESLPPGVLVTADAGPASSDLAGLHRVSWLARDYAVAVLPAVSSLRQGSRVRHRGLSGMGGPTTTHPCYRSEERPLRNRSEPLLSGLTARLRSQGAGSRLWFGGARR